MDKDARSALERATQRARKLLHDEFVAQLEGTYDVHLSGEVAPAGGAHLDARQRVLRTKIIGAIDHKRSAGMKNDAAVLDYIRDSAFTALNRFVALKMLEARELVLPCVSKGDQSSGYKEFCGLAPGVALLPDNVGYRLYLECIFDELSTEVNVLFDRLDPASVLWPRRQALEDLVAVLNASELSTVWQEDETIGWVYQYFNSGEERREMRGASQAPRNSRELAIRNQFFTPRYVVEFLVDNTLGRIWYEMRQANTSLADRCRYMVRRPDEIVPDRELKDPRDIRVIDPACGSGHFLLYAFDLLVVMYEEAFVGDGPASEATGKSLWDDFAGNVSALRKELPRLILLHNVHGVDIDPRCAQIAALSLWMRAQRAFADFKVPRAERQPIERTNVVVAEPMPDDGVMLKEFSETLRPAILGDLFRDIVARMRFAGEMGTLLRIEAEMEEKVTEARKSFQKNRSGSGYLPGFEPIVAKQQAFDFSGMTDDSFFVRAEADILTALERYAEEALGQSIRKRLFAKDAAHGVAFVDLCRKRYDVVLMNPPFGAGSLVAKKDFEKAYPRTKNDVYAAFVERGIQLLHKRGRLGAITSRTGFFLSSFQKWREEILLKTAPPVVFADLGAGVLDSAMVETAAYCLEVGA